MTQGPRSQRYKDYKYKSNLNNSVTVCLKRKGGLGKHKVTSSISGIAIKSEKNGAVAGDKGGIEAVPVPLTPSHSFSLN